jgi:uncharacterized protein (TIGR02145 family)
MKKIILIFLISFVVYSCSKTESTPTVTPPVVIKLSGCDSIKQGLLKTTNDTIRLVSCLSISGCDSVRLGVLKPNRQDSLRLLSCIKISGCDSVRLGVLKPNRQDSLRLLSCIKISGCDSVRLGFLKSAQDLLRLGCTFSPINIGSQIWMSVNLSVTSYRNGDIIPQITDPIVWAKTTTGAWCYYNNDPANEAIYGKLYNWYAVIDPRGLAPQGWSIPDNSQWNTLFNFLAKEPDYIVTSTVGGKMKATGTLRWKEPNNGATNQSGFTGLPGGLRNYEGYFKNITLEGGWWTSSTAASIDYSGARSYSLYYGNSFLSNSISNLKTGYSIRCIKD